MRVKPIIGWPGGKSRMLNDLLPLPPHVCYAEAFGGGLAVLLAKEPSKVEVVNDFNEDLVKLYRCCQFHLEALLAEMEWMITSRKNLMDMLAQPGLTDLQQAARFFLRNKGSFGGDGKTYGVQKSLGGGACWNRSLMEEKLRAMNARMAKVSVEHLSYERFLKLYDGKDTLFFLDPPYISKPAKAYEGWGAEETTLFAQRVKALVGNWIVTIGDGPLVRKLFAGYPMQEIATRNQSSKNTAGAATFAELIIRKEGFPQIQGGPQIKSPVPCPLSTVSLTSKRKESPC